MTKRFYLNYVGFLILCSAVLQSGCAPRSSVPTPGVTADGSPVERLRGDLDRYFSDPAFASAQWGVEVVSLDRGELLYERNSTKLCMPASNNKLLISAAALVRLGPEYRFETGIWRRGKIGEGTLSGDLIVTGTGDPSTAARFHSGDAFAVFKDWAARLKEIGIRKIAGSLVGDDRAFESRPLGRGWQWDDLAYGYSAPVTALQFNESLVTAEFTAAPEEGGPATLKLVPDTGYLKADCRVLTGPAGTEASIDLERMETGESVVFRGSVPLKGEPFLQKVAVRYPTLYFLQALKQTLQSEGIDMTVCEVNAAAGEQNRSDKELLWTHKSVALAEILKPLLKVSQNLYAETMVRELALATRGEGTFDWGSDILQETLHSMAIEKGSYQYADGSGLSRLNLISPDLLVRIFKFMYRHKYFSQFYDALPVAGVDGTLSDRMKGSKAEGNARAKTGSLTHVRSLSGYVHTSDGEMVAFAMIANNFLVSSKTAEYAQDSTVERLAAFTRH